MISQLQANEQLEKLSAPERIQWAHKEFDDQLILTTSFGTYAAVMLDLVKKNVPSPIIVSIDTGHNQETVDYANKLITQLDLNVERHSLPPPPEDKNHPPESMEEYLQRTKVDALEQALKKHKSRAWMSGVQRGETDHRKDFEFLMQRSDGLYKFHPLLDWDVRELYAYCKENNLPVNDHYFDPSKGEDQKQECGIHLTGMANESFTSSEL